ncbi:MAG: TIGR02147 family protein [Bdellovibrionales bacterium]
MDRLKSIFEYDNYRAFLKDVYETNKKANKKYSYRFFAKLAGFQSSNFLMLVIDGKRNLALPSIEQFAKALKLNKEEGLYFKNLVLFNQASTVEEKDSYAKELLQSQTSKKIHPLKLGQFNYLRNWYYVAIRELVNLDMFNESPDWISKHVFPNITTKQAQTALDELIQLGLLVRNEKGRLVQAHSKIATDDEVVTSSIAHFHRQALERASDAIQTFPRDKRDLSVVAVPINTQNIKMIKEKISNFRNELAQVIGDLKDADAVYQLNIQLFPIAGSNDGSDT